MPNSTQLIYEQCETYLSIPAPHLHGGIIVKAAAQCVCGNTGQTTQFGEFGRFGVKS